jgi:carboxypeptidase Taq
MLGNIIGLQLRDRFVQDYPGWEWPVAAGNFTDYINRFSENVWQYGSRYTPTQLIEHVSGSELQASYFLDYLEEKYT